VGNNPEMWGQTWLPPYPWAPSQVMTHTKKKKKSFHCCWAGGVMAAISSPSEATQRNFLV